MTPCLSISAPSQSLLLFSEEKSLNQQGQTDFLKHLLLWVLFDSWVPTFESGKCHGFEMFYVLESTIWGDRSCGTQSLHQPHGFRCLTRRKGALTPLGDFPGRLAHLWRGETMGWVTSKHQNFAVGKFVLPCLASQDRWICFNLISSYLPPLFFSRATSCTATPPLAKQRRLGGGSWLFPCWNFVSPAKPACETRSPYQRGTLRPRFMDGSNPPGTKVPPGVGDDGMRWGVNLGTQKCGIWAPTFVVFCVWSCNTPIANVHHFQPAFARHHFFGMFDPSDLQTGKFKIDTDGSLERIKLKIPARRPRMTYMHDVHNTKSATTKALGTLHSTDPPNRWKALAKVTERCTKTEWREENLWGENSDFEGMKEM